MSEVVMADGHFQNFEFTTKGTNPRHTEVVLRMMAHGTVIFPPANMHRVRIVLSDEENLPVLQTASIRKKKSKAKFFKKAIVREKVLPRRIIR